jgi:trigger factor
MRLEKTDNKNKVVLYFEISPERFEEGLKHSYNKNKNKLSVQGFRKGKAPRKLLEMSYGKEVFYEDAVDFILDDAYAAAVKEADINVVSRPDVDIEDISTETGVKVKAEVYTKPEITISDYKGITYKKSETEVMESEINQVLESELEKNARIVSVDREVKDGDIAVIDFLGMMDGVPFPGGEDTDFEITIGSKTFIDTFEEQIIGHKVGDKFDVNVAFPEGYQAEELSGKPAVFEVTVKEVKEKELPELNDEFAQDVSEFESLSEYKNSIEKSLKERKEGNAKRNKENEIMETLIAKVVDEIPGVMFDNQAMHLIRDFEMNLSQKGLSLEQYMQYTGQTPEALFSAYRATAENNVKGRLALEAIAVSEGFDVTDEDLENEIKSIAEAYKMEADKIKETLREEDLKQIREDIKVKRALDFIVDSAVETENEENEKTEDN